MTTKETTGMNYRVSQMLRRDVVPTMQTFCSSIPATSFKELLLRGLEEYSKKRSIQDRGFSSIVMGLAVHWGSAHAGMGDYLLTAEVMDACNALLRRYPKFEDSRAADALFSVLREGFAWGKYLRDGCHDYQLSPALTERLIATEVRGVPGEYLRLPFQSLAIRLDPDLFDGYHEALVVEQWIDANVLPQTNNDTLEKPLTEQTRFLFILMNESPQKRDAAHFYSSAVGKTVMLRVDPDTDLTECLAQKANRLTDQASAVVRLVLNLVLYLSWPDHGDVPIETVDPEWAALREKVKTLTGYKKERAKARLREMDPDRRLYVGAKLPFLSSGPASHGTGDKLLVRTLVSGHWKQQPCGEGRRERKLIRIEPFWRGPLDGPVSNPVRRVS